MNISIPTLIDELKSDDFKKRLNSIKHLPVIASALGPERTRSELIPFLSTELLDDEDDVLVLLADILGNLIDHVGGQGYCRILLPLLETLAQISDEIIREKILGAMKKMIPKNEDYFLSMLKRFHISEFYSCRILSTELIPLLYPLLSPLTQTEVLPIFKALMKDSLPMVRKNTAKQYSNLLRTLPVGQEKDSIEIFQVFLKDEEDFVRIYLIEGMIALSSYLPFAKYKDNLLGFFQTLATDQSWRVRYSLCEKIREVGGIFSKDSGGRGVVLGFYLKCLQESEPEMRNIAAGNIQSIAILISQKAMDLDEIVTKMCPLFKTLQSDPMSYVRASFADQFMYLSPVLGKKSTNELILPVFLTLLKDEEIEVKVNIFKRISELLRVLGVSSLLQTLIPALVELGSENNWRVRVQTIEHLPFFARQIGEEFFNERVIKLIGGLITDKIFAVRDAMIKTLYELTEILSEKWLEKHILEKYVKLSVSTNYLLRETFLFFVQKIGPILSSDLLTVSVIPTLIELSKDNIANVKMNCAKSLKILFPRAMEKDRENMRISLVKLSGDEDWDVRVTGKQSLEGLVVS